jgi:hypothetical protein
VSQIASFYVLPAKLVEDLIDAATPKSTTTTSRFLGFIPRSKTEREDHFWDFLESTARESTDFGFSGSVFAELDLFLNERGKTMLTEIAVKEPSDRLSKARGSWKSVFDYESAQKVRAMLSDLDVSAETIKRYCGSGNTAWSAEELTEPLQAAVTQAVEWMNDVGPDDVGLLSVG